MKTLDEHPTLERTKSPFAVLPADGLSVSSLPSRV
jgi:hypothetical protein